MSEAESTANWIEVGIEDDFKTTDRKYVEHEDEPIGIFKVAEGEYYAVGAMCSHQRISLMSGDVEDCIVTCPLHGAEFDLKTGEHLCMPAVAPIESYALKVEDGKIFIDFK